MSAFLVPDTQGAGTGTPLAPRSSVTPQEQERQPSVAAMALSKAQYIELCDTFRDKAQQAHQDARTWQNRALLAEASLATLRAAYEPAPFTESET
ncbi:hypothetical protein QFZ60_000487 [Arthrobacter sp. B2I5]|nr:hypothetical protein [Arthrobacter sp. B2I5]